MNTPYPRDTDLDAIVDVFAEADPGLRDPAVKREVVRGADALLRKFDDEMAKTKAGFQGFSIRKSTTCCDLVRLNPQVFRKPLNT